MYNPYYTHPCLNCTNRMRSDSNGMVNPYEMYPCPYIYNQNFAAQYGNEYFTYGEDDNYYRLDNSQQENSVSPIVLKDYGPQPYVVNLEQATKQNKNYRTALWTGKHLQLTLMSIKVGDDIGLEVHPVIDQFIRIEEGQGIVQMGPSRNNLNFQQEVSDGFAVFVPAGTWHNVINTGRKPLKVYSIYAPPQHPRGTVHETKEIAHGGPGNQER